MKSKIPVDFNNVLADGTLQAHRSKWPTLKKGSEAVVFDPYEDDCYFDAKVVSLDKEYIYLDYGYKKHGKEK